MQSATNRHVTSGTAATLRIGSPADLEVLAAIDLDASVLFERAGLHFDSSSQHEVAMAERRRWLECLTAGTVLIAVDPAARTSDLQPLVRETVSPIWISFPYV